MLNNSWKAAAAICAFSILAACRAGQGPGADLVDIGAITSVQANYALDECAYRSMERVLSAQGYAYYPVRRELYMPEEMWLEGFEAASGSSVNEGDALARFTYDVEALSVERELLSISLSTAEKNFSLGKAELQGQISQLSSETSLSGSSLKVRQLMADKLKNEYDYYIYTQNLEMGGLKKQIDAIGKKLEGFTLASPISGVVADRAALADGAIVPEGTRLMSIYDPSTVQIQAEGDVSLLRFGMPVTVAQGNAEYAGVVVSDPTVLDNGDISGKFLIDITDPLWGPGKMTRQNITVRFAGVKLDNALTLRSGSVHNEDAKKYVMLVENGMAKKRYVRVGVNTPPTDSQPALVQIVDGLKTGDLVLAD